MFTNDFILMVAHDEISPECANRINDSEILADIHTKAFHDIPENIHRIVVDAIINAIGANDPGD